MSFLNLGTNSYPNSSRIYLTFDDPALLDGRPLLAAHLVLTLDWFPYGSKIDDLSLYQQDEPTWDEATLTGNNEPALAAFTRIGPHRMRKTYARFSMDVTQEIADMRGSGDDSISFMLRRDTESSTLAMAGFWSREAEAGSSSKTATAIELVLGPEGMVELYDELPPMGGGEDGLDAEAGCSLSSRPARHAPHGLGVLTLLGALGLGLARWRRSCGPARQAIRSL